MFAMITVIGIPLAIAYWAIPALFLLSAITHFFLLIFQVRGIFNIAISLIACGLVLAAPAYLLNHRLTQKAQNFVAKDHNHLKLPIDSKVIAVRRRSEYKWNRGTTRCDGFCLHALLTGEAERILVTESKEPNNKLNLAEKVTAFSLQARDSCPAVKFTPGHHRLKIPTDKNDTQRSVNAIEEMKLRISMGDCLISEDAFLGDADMILSIQRLSKGTRNAKLGFSLNNNTISADRMTVHLPAQGNAGFDEKFRWTGVRYKPFAPVMVPGPQFGYQFEMGMGWLRTSRRINIASKYYERPNWVEFLTKTLGLELALKTGATRDKILEKIENVLEDNRPPTRAEWDVFSEYFNRVGIGRNTELVSRDFEIAMRILEASDFPPPPRLYNLSRYVAKPEFDAIAKKLASLMFSRLENGQTWATELDVRNKSSLTNLGLGIQNLPDEAVKPHFNHFMRVAQILDVRIHSYRAFRKIGVFGKQAVPVLLGLINSGLEGGNKFFRSSTYQHQYIAGLSGMCIAGSSVNTALPPMLRLLKQNKLVAHASYGSLLINALVRIGADSEEIWPYYSAANKNRTRKNFDYEVRRATSSKPDCDY